MGKKCETPGIFSLSDVLCMCGEFTFFHRPSQDGKQPADPDSGVSGPLSQPPAESGVPLPAINLLFKDGELKEWSGRAPPALHISAPQRDQPT